MSVHLVRNYDPFARQHDLWCGSPQYSASVFDNEVSKVTCGTCLRRAVAWHEDFSSQCAEIIARVAGEES